LTASDSESDVVKSYHLQADCYFKKPHQWSEFKELVEGILGFWFSGQRGLDCQVFIVPSQPGSARNRVFCHCSCDTHRYQLARLLCGGITEKVRVSLGTRKAAFNQHLWAGCVSSVSDASTQNQTTKVRSALGWSGKKLGYFCGVVAKSSSAQIKTQAKRLLLICQARTKA
jgi:hypothetical protein